MTRYAAAVLVLILVACLGDPVGPGTLTVDVVGVTADTLWTGAPGEVLPSTIRIKISDGAGHPVGGAAVVWQTVGRGSQITNAGRQSNAAGEVSAAWILGTDAAEEQRLRVSVQTQQHAAEVMLRARAVPYVVAQLRVVADTPALLRVGDTLVLHVDAIDPYGNVFRAPDPVTTVDSGLGSAAGQLVVGGPRRGRGSVRVISHGVGVTLPLHVTQFVGAIVPAHDTVVFSSLGAEVTVSYEVRDDRGRVVADTAATLSVSDTSVVRLNGSALQSMSPGDATLQLELSPASASIPLTVDQRIASLRLVRDTIRFDALFDTTTIHPIARDSLGFYVRQPMLVIQVRDEGVAQVAASTLKAVTQGFTIVTLRDPQTGISTSAPVIVHQLVRSIDASQVHFDALGDTITPVVTARDRLGFAVVNAALAYRVSDSTVARLDAQGHLHSMRQGQATLGVQDDETGTAITTDIIVKQRITALELNVDTVALTAVSDTTRFAVVGRDRLGVPVADAPERTTYVSTDPRIVEVSPNGLGHSAANGAALVIAQSTDGSADTAHVIVRQTPDSIVATVDGGGGILNLSLDSPIPVSCAAYDRNGFGIAMPLQVAPSAGGRWSGGTCSDIRVRRSGFDTLRVSAGSIQKALPVVLAVRPIVTPSLGEPLVVDSLPAGTAPWSPTLRRNSNGEWEIYFAAYEIGSDTTMGPANLHRLVSSDGVTFRYDGLALEHDSLPCGLQSSGIENVDIVPRNDGPGWRMYYAGGSFDCYGWQVFSAVSADERNWTKEPGIRVGNGGNPPPADPNTPPWPAGEGMVTELLPSGEWRMFVSTYEHVQPPADKFQITEWHSVNQLDWTYVGVVFSTDQLPPEGKRSVYSPTIREFAPGLWRMLMTADDLNVPGGRSRIWSAVSIDKRAWQFEGEILGAPSTKYFYSSLTGDRLVTIQESIGMGRRLYTASVQMP